MLTTVFVASLLWFLAAYLGYGRRLRRWFALDDARPTPATTLDDGVDYCPTRTPVLFGHHFSSIAGAGPIVGPVLAGIAFGWGPALVWILLGAALVGGVHDLGALVASLRHRARSIAEVAREAISPAAWRLFLVFIWLALVLVLACFIDLTAKTFTARTANLDGGAVATSSLLYIGLALAFGVVVYRWKVSLLLATLVFVPLVFGGIWLGLRAPVPVSALTFGGLEAGTGYAVILVIYCFIASLAPVWVLLQPRDYLSSFLLAGCLVGGAAGVVLGGYAIEYPAFVAFHTRFGPLFPTLFILVACGACSGFHSVVASGTTAKQIARESDALRIGYGAMLLEGVLAVLALATVMVATRGADDLTASPTVIFASGFGRFASAIGVPVQVGVVFGLLAISTFLLTTLDTCTRLARFVLEEFFGSRARLARVTATAVTLGLALVLLNLEVRDAGGTPLPAYKVIWPLFGATNQLLGGLALLTVTVWLRRSGRPFWFTAVPCAFMVVTTVCALGMKGLAVVKSMAAGGATAGLGFQAAYCLFLLVLAGFMGTESLRVLRQGR